MTMTEQLDQLREQVAAQLPADVLTTVREFTNRLAATGIVESAKGVGDPAPPFELTNANGVPISSRELLAHGPLVITFYRGNW